MSEGKVVELKKDGAIWWWCPGCKSTHRVFVTTGPRKPEHKNKVWQWNGSETAPTLSPSVNYIGFCHFFLRGGVIEFCSDSVHELAGQKVKLAVRDESDP